MQMWSRSHERWKEQNGAGHRRFLGDYRLVVPVLQRSHAAGVHVVGPWVGTFPQSPLCPIGWTCITENQIIIQTENN